jgi:hypothetical protein
MIYLIEMFYRNEREQANLDLDESETRKHDYRLLFHIRCTVYNCFTFTWYL